MWLKVIEGIAIPFAGTALGSACVFFMKKGIEPYDTACADRLCGRCDGRGFDLEPPLSRR